MARASSSPRRVLVVDDSALIRRVVCDTIGETADLVVVGEAVDGLDAIRRVHELAPDLVTLDLDMPEMGGLEVLGYIMSESPRPVVVLSGHEPAEGGDVTIRALELGAVDFVRKPSRADALDVETLRRRLVQALREAGKGRVAPLVPTVPPPRAWRPTPVVPLPTVTPRPAREVLVIAASTGGPKAVAELLPRLRIGDAAVLVVQHMPPGFTTSFARRLDELGPRPVREAVQGEPLVAGHVYVAPGGSHLGLRAVAGGAQAHLLSGAARHGVSPAADVTLECAAEAFGAGVVAVILTGMGRDGAVGARRVREAGGHVVVQHPDTCVVPGMPQAVIAAGAAHAVLPLDALPVALERALSSRGR